MYIEVNVLVHTFSVFRIPKKKNSNDQGTNTKAIGFELEKLCVEP